MEETADPTAVLPHETCANCETPRQGPWCYACGQHAEATHRSVRRLALEAAEHLFNSDGKTLTTLRLLVLRPAALTRAYLAGHRIVQVAPINLFLVTLVVVLFSAAQTTNLGMQTPTAAQTALIPPSMRWTVPVGRMLQQHQASFTNNLRESAEFFGLLIVPVAALLLGALFAYSKPRVPLYDHLIFALHSLSFQFILLAAIALLPDSLWILQLPMLAVMAAHLFFHMRGTYRIAAVPALLRMALLGFGTLLALVALIALWMLLAYAELWI